MLTRRTLARDAKIEGIGLHTGKMVHMHLRPAPSGSGVVFVRTDLDHAEIPATLAHVGPSFYATVIGREEVTVSTIEHLMAALYALQIDDVRVELDGPEVPVMDGSSRPFVDVLRKAGSSEHDEPRQYITIIRPVSVSHDEKRVAIYPCSEFRVTYAIDFDHPRLGYQELTAGLWGRRAFDEKLAPARTFTFERDVQALQREGLALGGSLDNAVVIGDEGILNQELRFPDEFVRHKMLDLTGDLSLLGHPVRGHVVAYRAGHDMHLRLAKRILECGDCWYLAPWSGAGMNHEAAAGA